MKKCKCGEPLPELATAVGDPFCSARCCRKAHGVVLSMPEMNTGPKPKKRVAA